MQRLSAKIRIRSDLIGPEQLLPAAAGAVHLCFVLDLPSACCSGRAALQDLFSLS